jgi:hypothetical protein
VPEDQKHHEAKVRPVQERGAIPLLRAVYRQEGFAGWYRGLTAQILKAALCQGKSQVRNSTLILGILFVSKERFEKWAWVILATLSRVRAQIALK